MLFLEDCPAQGLHSSLAISVGAFGEIGIAAGYPRCRLITHASIAKGFSAAP